MSIDNKVDDFREMQKIVKDIGAYHNQVYCGYLRQPVRHVKLGDKDYVIQGMCALSGWRCGKQRNKDMLHVLEDCPVYKARMGDLRPDDEGTGLY